MDISPACMQRLQGSIRRSNRKVFASEFQEFWFRVGSRIVACGAGDCADVHLVAPNLRNQSNALWWKPGPFKRWIQARILPNRHGALSGSAQNLITRTWLSDEIINGLPQF
jgi:hypothetical protein